MSNITAWDNYNNKIMSQQIFVIAKGKITIQN
jgi:hypothetical protein